MDKTTRADTGTAAGEGAAGMTLEQQIGQLFAVGLPGPTATPELLELIQREHVGAIILFSRNIRSREQTAALTYELQSAARAAGHPAPLLVVTDQENGIVRRLGPDSTIFPGSMALGAIADGHAEGLVYDVARVTARELKSHGINMNLAPVVDVNNNPANPVIGVRSFGERADQVARLGAAAVRGYQDGGVIATLKHFPGHGDTATDSHRALPTIAADLERLEALELVPFRRGVAAGAAAVMIAHVALPALTAGEVIPATIAPSLVRGLLREQLGFDGVIVSDCLEMDAIADGIGVARGAVMALQAGIDLILVSHRLDRQRAAIQAVRAAVASGELDADRIREAARRVLALKQRYLAWESSAAAPLRAEDAARHRELRDRAYALATTLVRDEAGLVPLRLAGSDELVVIDYLTGTITAAADTAYVGTSLLDAVRRHHQRVRALTLSAGATSEEIEDAVRAAQQAAVVLAVTLNLHRDQAQQRIMQGLVRRVVAAGKRVIGLAICDPYDASSLPEVGTYLATYDYSPPALESAASVLFGAEPPRGHAPVTLAPRADGGSE
jgi:beta-N-acetylhexosaminidase